MDILLVENSEMFSSWVAAQIQKIPGAEITAIITECDAAIAEVKSNTPDVVVLDLNINGGNGMDVLKTIKKNKLKTKVLVFTNYTVFKEQCMEYDAEYFFDKSNDFEELIFTIEKMTNELNNKNYNNNKK
ncbi:MAG: response regulator [Ignavibacteriae bacterium]|nr:DNA-binding response regulator [Ignavibacteriota bacterium]NOG97295.1 response regulator [Ignavibacteriota bacterium]